MIPVRRVLAGAVVVGVLLGPVAVVLALRPVVGGAEIGAVSELTAVAMRDELQTKFAAVLHVEWSTTSLLLAPLWTGLVTDVRLRKGDTLVEGDVIATIDGIARRGAVFEAPLFRPLGIDARGDDVAALQEYLARLGYLTDPVEPGRFDHATRDGVRRFAASIGVTGTAQSVFDPGWVVWMREPAVVVGDVALEAATVAPAPGAVVAVAPPTLSDARLVPTERPDVLALPAFLAGDVLVVTAAGEEVTVGVDPGTGRVEGEGVALLAPPAAGEDQEIEVTAVAPDERVVAAVPGAALVRADAVGGCVWHRTASSDPWQPFRFDRFDDHEGNVVLDDPVAVERLVGQEVLLNSAEILESDRCP